MANSLIIFNMVTQNIFMKMEAYGIKYFLYYYSIYSYLSYFREGSFKTGKMHGVGFLTVNGEREEVLMNHNTVICYKNGKLVISAIVVHVTYLFVH